MSIPYFNHWLVRVLAITITAIFAACGASNAPNAAPTSTPEISTAAAPTVTVESTSEPTATEVQTEEATEEADESTLEAVSEATDEAEAAVDVLVGDASRGDSLFHYGSNGAPPCSSCHQTDPNAVARFSLGPNLGNVSERAGTRVEGLSAEEYIHQSIVEPRTFLVPGFRNSMFPRFAEVYDEQEIADLIAYLLTL